MRLLFYLRRERDLPQRVYPPLRPVECGKATPNIGADGICQATQQHDHNVNQVAHRANAAGYSDVRKRCLSLNEQLENVIKKIEDDC